MRKKEFNEELKTEFEKTMADLRRLWWKKLLSTEISRRDMPKRDRNYSDTIRTYSDIIRT